MRDLLAMILFCNLQSLSRCVLVCGKIYCDEARCKS